jgi:hypothetical protein
MSPLREGLPVSTRPATATEAAADDGNFIGLAESHSLFNVSPHNPALREADNEAANEKSPVAVNGTGDNLRAASEGDVDINDVSGRMQASLTLNVGVVDKVWPTGLLDLGH